MRVELVLLERPARHAEHELARTPRARSSRAGTSPPTSSRAAISTMLRWFQLVSRERRRVRGPVDRPRSSAVALPLHRLAGRGDAVLRVPAGRRPPTAASRPCRPRRCPCRRRAARAPPCGSNFVALRVRPGRERRPSGCGRCATAPRFELPHDVFRRARGDDAAPPPSPASGPRSMTQSAVLITSRLCSITTTVLPRSTSRCSTSSSLRDVVEVQAGRRLVEQVERLAGVGPGQLGGQLHALGLAAGQRRRRLAERQVVEPDVAQRLQDAADLRDVVEQLERLADAHVQHVGDRSCRGTARPASRGCSGCRGRRRTRPTRRAGSASRSASGRCPRTPRSGRRAR